MAIFFSLAIETFHSAFGFINNCDFDHNCCVLQIYRKAALKIVSESITDIKVDTLNLQEFVGKPLFSHDRMYDFTPPGVIAGLAWTSMGKKTSSNILKSSYTGQGL